MRVLTRLEFPRWPALVITFLVTAAACSPRAEWQGTIEERDGVVHVSSPAEGLWQDDTRPPFSLELEQVFGAEDEPEEAILGSVLGGKSFAVDVVGNVHVLDRAAEQIISFAPDGSVRWRVGRTGQGPGEILRASGIVWDGQDRLYASLQNGGRVDVWDTDGNYISSHALANLGMSTAYVVGFLDSTTLVLWEWGRDQDGVTVWVLDVQDPWTVKAEFFVNGGFEDDPDLMDGTNIEVSTGGGRIWTGHRIEYLLRGFDSAGQLTRTIRRHVPQLVPTLSYRGTGWNFGEFKPPLVLEDGHSLVPRMRTPNVESAAQFMRVLDSGEPPDDLMKWESALDLLDPEGRYIGSVELAGSFDDIGTPMLIGPDGRLYTSVWRPVPQVRRYHVKIHS